MAGPDLLSVWKMQERASVSENTQLNPQPEESPENLVVEPESKEPVKAESPEAPADESTVGTGTSMAIGCIAGTVLLIVFGLIVLLISTLI